MAAPKQVVSVGYSDSGGFSLEAISWIPGRGFLPAGDPPPPSGNSGKQKYGAHIGRRSFGRPRPYVGRRSIG